AGTPFQYAGLAALLPVWGRLRVPVRLLLVMLLLLRLPTLAGTVEAIAANRTGPRFAPGPTRVAQLLAQEDAAVVALTWGIANQVVAFSGGRRAAVYEPYTD